MNLIEAKKIAFSTRDGRRVLQTEVSFELKPKQLLWIHGANGAGKSTFLDILMQRHPYQGSLELNLEKSKIYLVPQLEMGALHVPLTLGEYITLSCPGAFKKFPWLEEKLPPKLAQTLWNSASGGERRRAILLRALIHRPKLLLLDEPLNHLDTASKTMTFELLKKYLEDSSQSTSPSVVLVTHEDIYSYLDRFKISFSTLSLENPT